MRLSSKEKILKQAIVLFADQGYTGVSMRDLAKSAGLGVSTLYHHFPDKESLYLEAVQLAFSNKAQAFSEIWQSDALPREKLNQFVRRLTELMLADKNFHRLMQRELLEADAERMKLLAQGVFELQFAELVAVIDRLESSRDSHLVAISVLGLVCHHLEMQPIRRFLPGYQNVHENAEPIANHVIASLLNGLAPGEI